MLPAKAIRVFSYNLLSSSLASPDYFTHCAPANLAPETRLKKILAKLEKETDKKSIICLQELSRKWQGPLHSFFEKNDYHLVIGLYGHTFNGYMGVAMAWPMSHYSSSDVEIQRLSESDHVEWPPGMDQKTDVRTRGNPLIKIFTSIFDLVIRAPLQLVNKIRGEDKPESVYIAAKGRSNILISAMLKGVGSEEEFMISTYHMPCAFKTPKLMTIHSELAVRHTLYRAKGKPSVLAGDFNILPDSSMYNLLTTGEMDVKDAAFPNPVFDFTWNPQIGKGMTSAYAKFGGEPDFTNYARIQDQDSFIGVLDYCFLSKENSPWEVVKVDPIAHRDQIGGPLPNAEEPSDHVSIGVDLKLKHGQEMVRSH